MKSQIFFLLCLIRLKNQVNAAESSQPNRRPDVLKSNSTTGFNSSCSSFNTYKTILEEVDVQNHTVIQTHYNQMVYKLYPTMPVKLLFQKLWQTYKKCDPSSFEVLVRTQLSLFWLHNMNEFPDIDYFLMVANGFHKIKKHILYSTLNNSIQIMFERAQNALPSSLNYFFGQPEFCLMNCRFNEMLYQTDYRDFAANPEVRFAFTWHYEEGFIDEKAKIMPIFEELDINEENDMGQIPMSVNVGLLSKFYNNFYSRWPYYGHKIGGSKLKNLQHNFHIWSVKLVENNYLIFSQDEFLMCATTFYDNKRRYVYGLKNRTEHDTACQWSVEKCDQRS